jgi:hypothetical protein
VLVQNPKAPNTVATENYKGKKQISSEINKKKIQKNTETVTQTADFLVE